jgi:predicted metal-binding membrane protein
MESRSWTHTADAHTVGGASEARGTDLTIFGVLLALAAAAWLASALRMAGMDGGPGTDPGPFGFYISTWIVMMVAMMLPSVAPAALAYRGLRQRRAGRAAQGSTTALFLAGYFGVWAASGLLAYAALGAGRSFGGGLFAWDQAGRWAAASVLALTAVYELTPGKRACLDRCRGARSLPPAGWREGHRGALRMGLVHGLWCLGCCWALMAALFALGAMSLLWMVVIAGVIAVEKLLPWSTASTNAAAALLAALAIGLAIAPASVPGLTIPHGSRRCTRWARWATERARERLCGDRAVRP